MANIPKEKTYFLFALAPKTPPNASGYGIHTFCVRYEQVRKCKLISFFFHTVINY